MANFTFPLNQDEILNNLIHNLPIEHLMTPNVPTMPTPSKPQSPIATFDYLHPTQRHFTVMQYDTEFITFIPNFSFIPNEPHMSGYQVLHPYDPILLWAFKWANTGMVIPFSIFLTQNGVAKIYEPQLHKYHITMVRNYSGCEFKMAPTKSLTKHQVVRA